MWAIFPQQLARQITVHKFKGKMHITEPMGYQDAGCSGLLKQRKKADSVYDCWERACGCMAQ